MNDSHASQSILGIDVGEQRVGVARGRLDTRFAGPLTTLQDPTRFFDDIVDLLRQEQAAGLVIGLPRGLESQDTPQTARVREFGQNLEHYLADAGIQVPVYWIDEALTSQKAEHELQARGKPFSKPDVDALAATIILEDYLKENHA